ncbi:MAG TPA: cytochrome c oxidase subunit II, partial [Kofleriaceae bacterium]|nr:cytochrome c oxidase subunit II [Kofleriaceae bacterium]
AATPAAAVPAAKPKAWYEKFSPNDWDHDGTYWLPPSASSTANGPDSMFYAVLGLSIFFFVAITASVVYLVVKYRHRPGHKSEPSPAHNDVLEMTWTILPTIMCVFLFVYGWRTYLDNNLVPETKPENQVYVTGSKWNWNFRYYNGVEEPVLHAPLGEPVKLIITSTDVLHSFFVPAFRIKQDAVPRRYTYAWFYPTRTGIFRIYCAEYCGTDHSQMKTRVVVHSASDYRRFLDDDYAAHQNLSGPELGASIYEKKGCIGCHTVDGSPRIGPSWKGSFGTTITLADGRKVTMDEAYIKRAIESPSAEGRSGFPIGTMPITGLSDKEIEGVIAYIKSLK